MSPLVRSVLALVLALTLSCAGPLEEVGGIRFSPEEVETLGTAALTLDRVRGEPRLEVSNREVARTLRMLAPQLERVTRDPDLARRRMLAVEPPPELEGLLLDGAVEGRVVLASAELTGAQTEALTYAYRRHCWETHGTLGDCLNVMNGKQSLGKDARYRLACHFALASMWEGMGKELGDTVDLDRLASAVIFGFASWAVLAVVPEPISKILAAGLTVAMALWLGGDALTDVIGGWMQMTEAADQATTLPELMKAGSAYGQRMGRQTMRLLVMLVASFIADKGVANLPKLPKFNVAMQRVATAGGQGIQVVSGVREATVAEGRVTALYSKAAKAVKAGALKGGAGAGARKGPGRWVKAKRVAKGRAAVYQEWCSGHPATEAYEVAGVEFDGYDANERVLLEAKGLGYDNKFDDNLKPVYWFEKTGAAEMVEEAERQTKAAEVVGNMPIRWEVAEAKSAKAIAQLLKKFKNITVVYKPMRR